MNDRYFAFVSYASADRAAAEDLVKALEAQGLACWVAPRNIEASSDYGEQILQGIRDSTALVLVFSQHSNASKFCQREVERGVHYGRRIFPVRIDNSLPSGPMEFHLSVVQWLDAQADKDWAGIASQLVKSSERLSSQAPSGYSMPTGRGSKPYRFEERDLRTVEELAEALGQNWAAGETNFSRGLVTRWVEAEVGNHELALRLQNIEQERRTENHEKLSLAIAELSPASPPYWRGSIVTEEWAAANSEELQALLSSRARARLEKCPGWPSSLIERLESGLAQLDEWTSETDDSYIRKTALRFLVCPDEEALHAAVAARRRDCPEGRSSLASRLLDSAELKPLEAVLLVSMPARAFVSADEHARQIRRRRIARIAVPIAALLLLVAAGYGFHLRCLSRTTASFRFTVEGQEASSALGGGAPLSLELDGRPLAFDPALMRVSPGPHRLEVKDSRFLPLQAEVKAAYGRQTDWGTLNLTYGRGTVEIRSDPDGAQVFQNGAPLGKTPLDLASVKSGVVTYEVRDFGLGASVLTGEVFHGRTLLLKHRFPHGALEVSSDPAGVEIQIDAGLVGKTPLLQRRRPGPVTVRLKSAQWGEKLIDLEVVDATTNRVQHRFPRGSVRLTSDPPGIQVWREKAAIGVTPLKLDDLVPGDFEFVLVANEFINRQVKLTVRDAEVADSHHQFAGGTISVNSKPAGVPVWAAARQIGVTPLKTKVLLGDTLVWVAPTNVGFLPQLVNCKTNDEVALNFEARHGSLVAWGAGAPNTTNSPSRKTNNWMHFGQSTPPAGLKGILAVSAGLRHSLALKQDGTVVAWGDNDDGQCAVPSGLSDVVGVSAGGFHSLAVRRGGKPVAWGSDEDGQSKVPANLVDVIAVAAGMDHSLALRRDGRVVAWGSNADGQCNVPPTLTNVIAIAAGGSHSIALRGDGGVAVWGNSSYFGEWVSKLRGVVAIAAGDEHSLVLLGNGRVMVLGNTGPFQRQFQPNYSRDVKDVSVMDATDPVPRGLTNVVAIAAGHTHNLALTRDGLVVAWGAGFDSDNTSIHILSDEAVQERKKKGLPAEAFVAVEDSTSNNFGQSAVPKTRRKHIAIAAGGAHSLAIVAEDP